MKKKGQAVIIGVVVLIAIVVIIFLVANDSSDDTSGNVISERVNKITDLGKDCREEKVPYETTETYNYYLKVQVVDSVNQESVDVFGKGVYQEGIVNLKNVDNEAGWFTVTFTWETLNREHTDTDRHYIEPDETIEFNAVFDIESGEDNKMHFTYKSDPIQKTRTVTKYRTEEVCD